MSLKNVWSEILPRIKNQKEKQLVMELQTIANRLEASMQQMQQSRALTAQYEAIWDKLLVCRRSDLMAAVPLAGERLEQLRCTAAALSTAAQQLLPALQAACGMLSAFAAVNRATAGELEQAGALTLALEKLQLAELEDQLLVVLEQAAASCKQQLTAAAAARGDMQQHCFQQQQQQQQQQHGGGVAHPAANASSRGTHLGGGPAAAAAAATALPQLQQQPQLTGVVEQQQQQQQQQQQGVAHAQYSSGPLLAHPQHSELQQQLQQAQQVQHAERPHPQVLSSEALQQLPQQIQQLPDGVKGFPAAAHPAAAHPAADNAATATARHPIPDSETTAAAGGVAGVADRLTASHSHHHHQQQQQQHAYGTTSAAAGGASDVVSGSLPSQELLAVLAAAEAGRATDTSAPMHLKQAAVQPCTHLNPHQQQQQASNGSKGVHATAEAARSEVAVLQHLEGSSSPQRNIAGPAQMRIQQQLPAQQQCPTLGQKHTVQTAGADCRLGPAAGRCDVDADDAPFSKQRHKPASANVGARGGAAAAAAAAPRDVAFLPHSMLDYACGQAVSSKSHGLPSMYTQAE